MYFKNDSERFKAVLESLQGKQVAVLSHLRPDGDCIGSAIALVRVLRAEGIDAVGMNPNSIPQNLRSFLGDTPLLTESAAQVGDRIPITVDCADHGRIGADLKAQAPSILLNVDHHISNECYAETNIVLSDVSATAEILAGIFLDLKLPVDAVTAQALYVGIATDTGQFRFPSTTAQTFALADALCRLGADPAAAALALYECEPFSRIKLLRSFLGSLKLEHGGRVCVGTLPDGIYEATGASLEEAEGMVDYTRSIDGVEIGVLIEDRSGSIKCSLRAKDPKMAVHEVAREFSGGGHACAAGLNVEDSSLETFYPTLMQALGKHLETLDRKGLNG